MIGDAYMVASGLPERSERKKHVSEIATMALDLLQASSTFTVPNSKDKVQIRIGIHTGSCGAGDSFLFEVNQKFYCLRNVLGIVGTKMLRYCLFGKTLDTLNLLTEI